MMQRLAGFPPHADSDRYNEAKEKLPFDGPLPTFEFLRSSSHIYHSNSNGGQVRTTAITFHCDQQHSSFLSRLLIRYYEIQGRLQEQFVPHSLLHGNDSTNQKAYRNAIILQNQYLLARRILPVKKSPSLGPQTRQSKIYYSSTSYSQASSRPPNRTSLAFTSS